MVPVNTAPHPTIPDPDRWDGSLGVVYSELEVGPHLVTWDTRDSSQWSMVQDATSKLNGGPSPTAQGMSLSGITITILPYRDLSHFRESSIILSFAQGFLPSH